MIIGKRTPCAGLAIALLSVSSAGATGPDVIVGDIARGDDILTYGPVGGIVRMIRLS